MATKEITIKTKKGSVDIKRCKLKKNRDECFWHNSTDGTMIVKLDPGFFTKTRFEIPGGEDSETTGVSDTVGTCTYTVKQKTRARKSAAADPSIIIEA